MGLGLCCPEGGGSAQCGMMAEVVSLGLSLKPGGQNPIVQVWLLSS